jgi:1,4-alpha-glucan branching enzyme
LILKEYTKTGRSCRVTFELPSDLEADTVVVLGDFNDWDPNAKPLKRRKDGSYATTLSLKPGAEYRFRYLVDGERWVNDDCADRLEPNRYGSEDSVISV